MLKKQSRIDVACNILKCNMLSSNTTQRHMCNIPHMCCSLCAWDGMNVYLIRSRGNIFIPHICTRRRDLCEQYTMYIIVVVGIKPVYRENWCMMWRVKFNIYNMYTMCVFFFCIKTTSKCAAHKTKAASVPRWTKHE